MNTPQHWSRGTMRRSSNEDYLMQTTGYKYRILLDQWNAAIRALWGTSCVWVEGGQFSKIKIRRMPDSLVECSVKPMLGTGGVGNLTCCEPLTKWRENGGRRTNSIKETFKVPLTCFSTSRTWCLFSWTIYLSCIYGIANSISVGSERVRAESESAEASTFPRGAE